MPGDAEDSYPTYESYREEPSQAAVWVPAPGWPQPPSGWTPPPGWRADPTWPPAPPGWSHWRQESVEDRQLRAMQEQHERILSNVATPQRVHRRLLAAEHQLRLQASLAHHVSRPAPAELQAGTYAPGQDTRIWEDFQMGQGRYLEVLVEVRDFLLSSLRSGTTPDQHYVGLRRHQQALSVESPVRTLVQARYAKCSAISSTLGHQAEEYFLDLLQRCSRILGPDPDKHPTPRLHGNGPV